MRLFDETHFLAKGNGFYDSYIGSAVDPRAIAVYEILRRHVWRSTDSGHSEMKASAKAGYLHTRMSQKKIAAMTGLTRKMVVKYVEFLRSVGWVYTDEAGSGFEHFYTLGECSNKEDRKEGKELFFADFEVEQMVDRIKRKLESSGKPLFKELGIDERTALVKEDIAGRIAVYGADN